MERVYTHVYRSPLGPLYIAVDREGTLTSLQYQPIAPGSDVEFIANKYACGEVEKELDEYFAGERRTFSVSVQMRGTEFQRLVWSRLRKMHYGTTMSYATLAQKIGRRDAAQAVGNAVARNPVVIVVPCHRIVNQSGAVGSYAKAALGDQDGTAAKRYLLALEGALPSEG